MSYENAPATAMLATHCACCSRPLVDAVSVEAGVGPECRKKHGYGEAQSDPEWIAAHRALGLLPGFDVESIVPGWGADARRVCNVLVHRVAVEQDGSAVTTYVNAIAALGFTKLAERVARRLATVRIAQDEHGGLVVKAPYDDRFVEEMRRVPGRRWDKAAKANWVPASSRVDLWCVLQRCFPGQTAIGPRGLFTIKRAA